MCALISFQIILGLGHGSCTIILAVLTVLQLNPGIIYYWLYLILCFQGTAYGYIRYAMKESADAAKMLLDGATIAGSTMRLSFADNNGDNNKRAKIDH